ncbi:MAG: hypothetical protein DSY81_11630 [Bacillota bacterium]|nr:MAG: hypothetical protein DSY81_11630 [Bacillota bacterium]
MIMNKSTLLGLALAMLVPTVALADGVTIGGDLRLRWDYSGNDTAASVNSSSAVINFDLDAAVNDNVSFSASLRHDFAFGDGSGGSPMGVQEAYASIGDLGSASGVLAGWSLDVGRMNNPDYGRIINSDDWDQTTAPASSDGYHLASDMGGVGIDIYYFGGGNSPAGSADSALGANFDLGDMGGFADITIGYWSGSSAVDSSNTSITISNIGGDSLAGVDLDVQYATSDDGTASDDGTLTSISASYGLGDMGMTLHASNTIADATWTAMSAAAHGTNGIADIALTAGIFGADIDNTTIGLSFSPMDGVDATINFITLATDAAGTDLGTETDLVLSWECGSDVTMDVGYATFSADTAGGLADDDFFYLQTGWDF